MTGPDHLSMTESVDDFDQVALFYKSVLGLRSDPTVELAAPFGLIRSRAASDPAQRVRITLNTAPFRRGAWSPAVRSVSRSAW